MKNTFKIVALVAFVFFALGAEGQKQKKVQKFKVSKVIDVPAAELWEVVGEDYGKIAYSHPRIMTSDYIGGSLKGQEGAQRICYFNEKQTQFLKEQMVDFAPERMSFTNKVFQAGKFPVDPDYTKAVYRIKDLGDGKSEFSFDMQYRTKPAFMGSMTKGKFKKLINDYFIAVEHYTKTGEPVTRDNFKEIKKLYVQTDDYRTDLKMVASIMD